MNGSYAKPSREAKVGDKIEVKRGMITYSYLVTELVANRQPAKSVPQFCQNITPQTELDKLNVPRETIFVFRERGTGRPTKKERREIDAVMGEMFLYDDDELEPELEYSSEINDEPDIEEIDPYEDF